MGQWVPRYASIWGSLLIEFVFKHTYRLALVAYIWWNSNYNLDVGAVGFPIDGYVVVSVILLDEYVEWPICIFKNSDS